LRERAREQFPAILLSVLGVIQALALELLWERGVGGLSAWRQIDAGAAGLLQVVAVFQGVVLIWVVYASLVLRFSWVPSMRDVVFPFVIGALEFVTVECMRPDRLGAWFGVMAVIFVSVSLVTFLSFGAAIREGGHRPLRGGMGSYLPTAGITLGLGACALLARWIPPDGSGALAVLALANLGLLTQLLVVRYYWHAELAAD
jgi:hypothetical protein